MWIWLNVWHFGDNWNIIVYVIQIYCLFGVIYWHLLLSSFVGKRSASINSGARVNSSKSSFYSHSQTTIWFHWEVLNTWKCINPFEKPFGWCFYFLKKYIVFELVQLCIRIIIIYVFDQFVKWTRKQNKKIKIKS